MSSPEFRIPPQSIESEKALLGALMLRPDALYATDDSVDPEAFYVEKHRLIYQAMLDLHGRTEPVDMLSVSTRLEEKKQLEAIGGRAYLTELVNTVPSSSNVKYYAEIVQRKYTLRKLIDASAHIGELGYSEDRTMEELLDDAEKQIFGVTNLNRTNKYISLKEGLTEAWERLDKLHKSKENIRGVPTGFRNLDNLLSGLQNSDLVILAARPSMGKTTFALDIARNAATKYNVPVGIFSLETSAQQLVDRMLAAESKVDAWKIRTGTLSKDEEFFHIQEALDRLSKAPIYINDMPSNNILQIRSVARKLKSEYGMRLMILDYLQLITTPRSYDSMVQQVTEISRGLKSIGRELNIPVLALSQLSRAIEQRRDKPRLSDLRDSGALEQDADVVMFIHREDRYREQEERDNIAEILIEKHRNGPLGKAELFFDEKKSTFLSIDKNYAAEQAFSEPAEETTPEQPAESDGEEDELEF